MAHCNWHRVTLQVYRPAQFPGLGRCRESARVIPAIGMHIAVSRMKSLKDLMNLFDQLRRYPILTMIHGVLLSFEKPEIAHPRLA
jgi:hypothetical protein